MAQHHRFFQLIAGAAQNAVLCRTRQPGHAVLGIVPGGDAFQFGATELPAVAFRCLIHGGGGDRNIPGNGGNGDPAVLAAGCGHILTAHGNGDLHSPEAIRWGQYSSIGAASQSRMGGIVRGDIGQRRRNLIEGGLPLQQRGHHRLCDQIHSLRVGMYPLIAHVQVKYFRFFFNAAVFQIDNCTAKVTDDRSQFLIELRGLAYIGIAVFLIRVTPGCQRHAVNFRIRVALGHLVKHNGIGLTGSGRLRISKAAVPVVGDQGIIVDVRSTQGTLIIAEIICTQEHSDNIRLFSCLVIMEVDTPFPIADGSLTLAWLQDTASGPGIVYKQFQIQRVSHLLPPGILSVYPQRPGGIIDRVASDGRIIGGIIGNTGESGNAVTQDGNGFTGIVRPLRAADGAGRTGVGVAQRQDVELPAIIIAGHSHVHCHGVFRGCQISIGVEFCVDCFPGHRIQNTVFIEPGQTDTAGGVAIAACCTERGGPNAVAGSDGNCNGIVGVTVIAPAAGSIVNVVVVHQRPEVGPRTDVLRQCLKVFFIHSNLSATSRDDQISCYLLNGDLAISITGIGNIHTVHGDSDGQIFPGNGFRERLPGRDSLIIAQACLRVVQHMRHVINNVFTRLDFVIIQQGFQNRIRNVVHALGIRMDAVRQVSSSQAALAQIQSGYAIMLANRFQDRAILGELCFRIVGGGVAGQYRNDLSIRIVMLHTQNRCCISICQILPLGSSQLCFRGGSIRVKAAQRHSLPNVIHSTVEQNDIRSSVASQILNPGQRCHGCIFTQVTGIAIHSVQHPGASPAIVDTQLCIQFLDQLHPPSIVHIGQQIVLGIPGTVFQIEAIIHRDVSSEGTGAAT